VVNPLLICGAFSDHSGVLAGTRASGTCGLSPLSAFATRNGRSGVAVTIANATFGRIRRAGLEIAE
jgi:hypothetical protein